MAADSLQKQSRVRLARSSRTVPDSRVSAKGCTPIVSPAFRMPSFKGERHRSTRVAHRVCPHRQIFESIGKRSPRALTLPNLKSMGPALSTVNAILSGGNAS